MTIKDQMIAMRDYFATLSQQDAGMPTCFICSDLVHVWKQLFNNPNSPKLLLYYAGETQRTTFPGGAITGRVDRKFSLVVSRGRSLTATDRGLPLTEDNQNARPLFDIVEQYRDACRAFIFDPNWCERPVDYTGTRPFSAEGTGAIVDAYAIDFSVGVQLGMLGDGNDSETLLPP